jgi:hypothetical protein
MNWLGNVSAQNGNRVIYRNNHYNRRFGALCADKIFEENLRNKTKNWEILDSRVYLIIIINYYDYYLLLL